MSGMTMQGPPRENAPCVHDSTRRDGTLDDHCLRCGAEGYWHDGHNHAGCGIETCAKCYATRPA